MIISKEFTKMRISISLILLLNINLAVANEQKTFEAYFSAAKLKMTNGKYREALVDCKRGITLLGDKYWSKETIDDTSMKLALAKIKEREGNIKVAANLTCNMLETRISLYKQKADGV